MDVFRLVAVIRSAVWELVIVAYKILTLPPSTNRGCEKSTTLSDNLLKGERMYYKKNVNYGVLKDGHKISLRLSDDQYDYVCMCACNMRMSVSDFIRQIVDNNIRISKGVDDAHIKSNKHNKL